MLLLAGAVGLLMLITCANLANLFLTRVLSRRGELAVRMALGANGGRLVRQLLSETLMLAAFGGVLGLFVAQVGLDLLVSFAPVP